MQTFENIASLGGSPDNVVIAGLSAGANFVSNDTTYHLGISTLQNTGD